MGFKLNMALWLPPVAVLLGALCTILLEGWHEEPGHNTLAGVLWGGALLASLVELVAVPLAVRRMLLHSEARTFRNFALIVVGALPILYAILTTTIVVMSLSHMT